MTLESYEKAKIIVGQINSMKNEISDLRYLLDSCDLSQWRMEVRPSDSFPIRDIDHCGMLPEFIQMILEKKLMEYSELEKKIEEL